MINYQRENLTLTFAKLYELERKGKYDSKILCLHVFFVCFFTFVRILNYFILIHLDY